MNNVTSAVLAIVSGAFALAIISVVFSQRATTAQVIQAGSSGLSNVIASAVNPITMQNPTSLGNSTFSTPASGGSSGGTDWGKIATTAAQVIAAFA